MNDGRKNEPIMPRMGLEIALHGLMARGGVSAKVVVEVLEATDTYLDAMHKIVVSTCFETADALEGDFPDTPEAQQILRIYRDIGRELGQALGVDTKEFERG